MRLPSTCNSIAPHTQEVSELSGDVPAYMKAWLTWTPSWQAFQTDFLRLWGGRYGPALKHGKWWLWFSSIYLHRDLQHIVSNMLLFVAMSVHLELNYGWWRLLLVWLMSGARLPCAPAPAVQPSWSAAYKCCDASATYS